MSPTQIALSHLPKEPGTYALTLHLEEDVSLRVGRLGAFDFPAGYYVYVGSAFGLGGLYARLKRHINGAGRPHWHIDYLRRRAIPTQAWFLAGPPRCEHAWAKIVEEMEKAAIPVPGFGASDCRCPAHLFHYAEAPPWECFSAAVALQFPNESIESLEFTIR